jgi:hypothetical protein
LRVDVPVCAQALPQTMLVIRDQDYFNQVAAFAKDNNLYEFDSTRPHVRALGPALKQLERFIRKDNRGELLVRVVLYRDFAPRSFGFFVERKADDGWHKVLVGGLIYHGEHDGGRSGNGPTFAVTMAPTIGWSIHT